MTLGLMVLTVCAWVSPARCETAYFLMSGPNGVIRPNESYVVAVTDPVLIQEARSFLSGGPRIPELSPSLVLVPEVTIADGSAPENLNYANPARPAWNWHATTITKWVLFDPTGLKAAVVLPELHSRPSQVPELLAAGVAKMSLLFYPLVMELTPAKAANVVNLSTRGWVDAGERVLIGGFIVEGGQPRNVFIRGLGPSLGNLGVREPLADPEITLFRGQTVTAMNDSWRSTYLGTLFPPDPTFAPPPQELAWMVPGDDREAVLWLSLAPGAYTIHVASRDGTPGVALVELYDLDARAAQ